MTVRGGSLRCSLPPGEAQWTLSCIELANVLCDMREDIILISCCNYGSKLIMRCKDIFYVLEGIILKCEDIVSMSSMAENFEGSHDAGLCFLCFRSIIYAAGASAALGLSSAVME